MKRFNLGFMAVLAALAIVTSCGTAPKEEVKEDASQLTGSINIDGSSTVFPITEAVAEEYADKEKGVKVVVNYSGTGGGFKKFAKGETVINNASRPIKEKEIKACKEAGIEFIELTVAYDGLAVVINKENDWAKTITVAELKKLWEPAAKGTINTWADVRAGWPAEKINLYGPGTSSGTFDYFTEAIVGESGSCRTDYSPSEDDNVLVNGIVNDKNAMGYFGLAYYEENSDKLSVAGIDNGKGAVKPSLETVKNGSYEPLSRPLFIYVNKGALAQPEVADFVDFYLQSSLELALEAGYIPLPESELAVEQAKVK